MSYIFIQAHVHHLKNENHLSCKVITKILYNNTSCSNILVIFDHVQNIIMVRHVPPCDYFGTFFNIFRPETCTCNSRFIHNLKALRSADFLETFRRVLITSCFLYTFNNIGKCSFTNFIDDVIL